MISMDALLDRGRLGFYDKTKVDRRLYSISITVPYWNIVSKRYGGACE